MHYVNETTRMEGNKGCTTVEFPTDWYLWARREGANDFVIVKEEKTLGRGSCMFRVVSL